MGRPVNLDTVQACQPEGQVEPLFLVSRYRLIGAVGRGDTVLVSAAVESVAEERGSPVTVGRRLVHVRTQLDTLRWLAVGSHNASWRICGISKEGIGVGESYANDDNTDWVPTPGSWTALRATVDSLARLPLR